MPLLLTGDRVCPECGTSGPAIRRVDIEYPPRVGDERPATIQRTLIRYERCGHVVDLAGEEGKA